MNSFGAAVARRNEWVMTSVTPFHFSIPHISLSHILLPLEVLGLRGGGRADRDRATAKGEAVGRALRVYTAEFISNFEVNSQQSVNIGLTVFLSTPNPI